MIKYLRILPIWHSLKWHGQVQFKYWKHRGLGSFVASTVSMSYQMLKYWNVLQREANNCYPNHSEYCRPGKATRREMLIQQGLSPLGLSSSVCSAGYAHVTSVVKCFEYHFQKGERMGWLPAPCIHLSNSFQCKSRTYNNHGWFFLWIFIPCNWIHVRCSRKGE